MASKNFDILSKTTNIIIKKINFPIEEVFEHDAYPVHQNQEMDEKTIKTIYFNIISEELKKELNFPQQNITKKTIENAINNITNKFTNQNLLTENIIAELLSLDLEKSLNTFRGQLN